MDTLENLEMDIARRDEVIREQGDRILQLEKEVVLHKKTAYVLSKIVITLSSAIASIHGIDLSKAIADTMTRLLTNKE